MKPKQTPVLLVLVKIIAALNGISTVFLILFMIGAEAYDLFKTGFENDTRVIPIVKRYGAEPIDSVIFTSDAYTLTQKRHTLI